MRSSVFEEEIKIICFIGQDARKHKILSLFFVNIFLPITFNICLSETAFLSAQNICFG